MNPTQVEVLTIPNQPIHGVESLPHFKGVNVLANRPLVLEEKAPVPKAAGNRLSKRLLLVHQLPRNDPDVRPSVVRTLQKHLIEVGDRRLGGKADVPGAKDQAACEWRRSLPTGTKPRCEA